MFTGDYCFFEYKSNIPGYTGQDYGGFAQYLYLIVSVILLTVLLVAMRKTPQQKARKIVGVLGIFITVLYVIKTVWESCYDVKLTGAFNTGLLPLDACSLIMPAAVLTGFGKGRIQRLAACWTATGGVVGGISTMLFLNAFKFYPFLSFGAAYSMLWHFLMVFMGLLILVATPPRLSFSVVRDGFLFHLIASVIVIPVDFIFKFDFMMYRELGGIPIFEEVASELTARGLQFLNPLLMLVLYFAAFTLIYLVAAGLKNRKPPAGKGITKPV